MTDLRPCPECRRHVRIDETACPFCRAVLAPATPPTLPVGRLTRAAVFAAGAALAGCGGPQKTEGPPPAEADAAAVAAEPDAGTAQPPPPPPDHGTPMPYGAPPARDRLV